MEKAIVKFNGGAGALLCSSCRMIIKTFKYFTEEETELYKSNELLPQYCENCKLESICSSDNTK